VKLVRRYRAGIVGLGQVGMLFDEDKKRSGVWTHFTAYERLADRFELVAVCDVDPHRRSQASARAPQVRCYDNIDAMLAAEQLEVVSLCTPPELHGAQILACAGQVRAVICEKPLGDLATGEKAVAACAAANTLLVVNYYKRYDGCMPHVLDLLHRQVIGKVRFATALYTGPFDAVGSHSIDLLRFLLGKLTLKYTLPIEPDRLVAIFTFGEDGEAALHGIGPREDLVFELDLIGSEGRIRVLDNCARAKVYRFIISPHYGGYRELSLEPEREYVTNERFLPLFVHVADWLDGKRIPLVSDGASALETQRLMEQIRIEFERKTH